MSRIFAHPPHTNAGNLRRDSGDCGNDAGGSRTPFEKYDLTTAGVVDEEGKLRYDNGG